MEDEDDKQLALRIEVTGRGAGGFQYQMDLIGTDERRDDDVTIESEDFDIYVAHDSAPKLDGATIDFVQKLQEAGFKFDNPNSPWSDPLAAEVAQVIDSTINPQIASHGGFVTLLDVKDQVAFITMGGGCQGCGMADVTLKQGIEGMILEAVPQITAVRDATDHTAGDNPYFS